MILIPIHRASINNKSGFRLSYFMRIYGHFNIRAYMRAIKPDARTRAPHVVLSHIDVLFNILLTSRMLNNTSHTNAIWNFTENFLWKITNTVSLMWTLPKKIPSVYFFTIGQYRLVALYIVDRSIKTMIWHTK